MFYRPNFCCHCGEKIIRETWTPLTSRRFCDFCAVEQKQHDLIHRALAIVVTLIGVAGLMAYFGSGSGRSGKDATAAAQEPKRAISETAAGPPANAKAADPGIPVNTNASTTTATEPKTGQRTAQAGSSTESVYYCGAITKKGTPCTRRVKTPGRCWQHAGQSVQP
jgi:hypothetical protein